MRSLCLSVLVVSVGLIPAPRMAAAQVVRGRVVDVESKAPLGGAAISIVRDPIDVETVTLSDSTGAFIVRVPAALRGYSDVDLGAVGGKVEGGLTSQSPDSAGILVGREDGRAGIALALHMGSSSNRPGIWILDGAGTVAPILVADGEMFAGRWNAGFGYTDYHAGGAFCAKRLGPVVPSPR